MHLSRRDFVHASCAITAASLVPNPLEARLSHGSAVGAAGNSNRVTINVVHPLQTANMAKNISWSTSGQTYGVHPSIMDANGYPASAPAAAIGANLDGAIGYFGDYAWSWTGEAAMQFSPPCLIRSTALTWGVFANNYQFGNSQTGNQYTNYDAIHEFNA